MGFSCAQNIIVEVATKIHIGFSKSFVKFTWKKECGVYHSTLSL